MSDPNNDDAFEQHKRIITSLGTEGLKTVEQEYNKASHGKDSKKFKGVCSVCKESFYPGFAVRCSDKSCEELIFHQSCFGTHAILVHQPRSITIIVRGTETPGTWEYVDANNVPFTLPTIGMIPSADEVRKEESNAPIIFYGPDDDSIIQPTTGDPEITVPEDTISAYDTMAEDKMKTPRSKKRSKAEE